MTDEIKVPICDGEQFLIFPSSNQNKQGVDYVRFEDKEGKELLYYDIQEWIDDPKLIMGCIMSAILKGAEV